MIIHVSLRSGKIDKVMMAWTWSSLSRRSFLEFRKRVSRRWRVCRLCGEEQEGICIVSFV